jgi:HAD superfamily hydrolase (TIGR01490 family)
MEKRYIAVFDFDGTLTKKDTLLEFVRFTYGSKALYAELFRLSPLLVLMKLRLYPNGKMKEKFFSHFFRGWRYVDFKAKCEAFADVVEGFKRSDVLEKLIRHCKNGDTVYVVSASIVEWVQPWCERYGVHMILGTQIEENKDGIITGRFSTPNCYGQEKVYRLLALEPDRGSYCLYAYGDSRGDQEMLAFADIAYKL